MDNNCGLKDSIYRIVRCGFCNEILGSIGFMFTNPNKEILYCTETKLSYCDEDCHTKHHDT